MCIGLPMQVHAVEPGHAQCRWQGELRRVRTALVGEVAVGEWLLIFLDTAQERIDAQRAHEIAATLALVAGAQPQAEAAFDLPSRMSVDDLRALSGAASMEIPR